MKIGLVDDHPLFVSSFKALLETNKNFNVVLIAHSGAQLQQQLNETNDLPDIILLDVNMPEMGGAKVAMWLKENFPNIKVSALSTSNNDGTIMRMLKAGCCAYLYKSMNFDIVEKALEVIYQNGFFNGDERNIKFRQMLKNKNAEEKIDVMNFSDKELMFLKLACSELTYVQIADQMCVGKRTVDGYREALFSKFNVLSRVGLCLEAIRMELVEL